MSDENPQNTDGTQPVNDGTSSESNEDVIPKPKVNSIVQDRLQRDRQKRQQQLNELGFESLDEVAEFKQQYQQEKQQQLEEQQKFKELYEQTKQEKDQLLSEKESEIERLRRTYREEKVQRTLSSAASDAVNPDQVVSLLRDRIDLDDEGNPYPTDENGNRLTDGSGNYMSVDAYVDKFLEENPHFLPASSGRGANSTSDRHGGNTPDDIDLNRLQTDTNYAVENLKDFERVIKDLQS